MLAPVTLALSLALAATGAATATADPLQTFPYRHVTVVPGPSAPGGPAPDGTLWVEVDDGTAVPRDWRGRAIPADGTPSQDAAAADPTVCGTDGGVPTVCWRYWQRVRDEVRIWTLYQGSSCVLIASLTGERTRLVCDGRSTTL